MTKRYIVDFDLEEDVEFIIDTENNIELDLFEIPNLLNMQDKNIKELEEEITKLKQQLSDEIKSHDLCIDSLNEESENLRKQIKFESEARKRFKQFQNQKAIEVLEQLLDRYNFYQNSDNDTLVEPVPNDIMTPIFTYVLDQISELKGDK